jgi:hypothetical protein
MEENKSNIMAEIALSLQDIKELMQEKEFTHFYIPDQFNYDASVDEYFEPEIWDDNKNWFAWYSHHGVEVRFTIEGIYLENDELSFDVGEYAFYDDDKEPNAPTERMSVAEVVELAERYKAAYYDYDLFMVLEHYIELLNRYDQENAYITK